MSSLLRESISLCCWFLDVHFGNNKPLLISSSSCYHPYLVFLPFDHSRKPIFHYMMIIGSKTIFPSTIGNAILIFFSMVGNLHVTSKILYLWECNIVKYMPYEQPSFFFEFLYIWYMCKVVVLVVSHFFFSSRTERKSIFLSVVQPQKLKYILLNFNHCLLLNKYALLSTIDKILNNNKRRKKNRPKWCKTR